MGINSKNKGQRGESELAHLLQERGYKARRGQQYCGANGDADVVGLPGIHIECKRDERLNIYSAMEQSIRDCQGTYETPCVFHRKNRKPWLVTMTFADWMDLYEVQQTVKNGGA